MTSRHARITATARSTSLRRAMLVLAIGVALVPAAASATGTLDQQQTTTTDCVPGFACYGLVSGAGTSEGRIDLAQTITPELSGTLDQVDLQLAIVTSPNPSQPLTVEIRDVASDKPGPNVLASTTVPRAEVSDYPGGWVSVEFASPATVSAGTPFAIVASARTSDHYGWLMSFCDPGGEDPCTDAYPGGMGFDGSPSAWSGYPSVDVTFKTYVTESVQEQPPGELEEEVSGGETVTTDHEGTGATPQVPVQTEIVVPDGTAGTITVQPETILREPPTGFSFFDRQVDLSGPPAPSAADPYVVTFTLDWTLIGLTPPADVRVFRDGEQVPECAHASSADPDPCVADRRAGDDGDAVVTVRTTHFSDWNFGPPPVPPGVLNVDCPDPETTPAVAVECSLFVSAGTPAPTGTVSLAANAFQGTLSRRTCPVSSSADPCEFTYMPKGNGTATRSDKITVTYSGSSTYPKQVKTLNIAVKPKPVPILNVACGEQTTPTVPVQCSVSVEANGGAGQPTGSVALSANPFKGTLSPRSCPASSACSFTYTPKGTGSPTRVDTIRATYPGDARYQRVSALENVNVVKP